jgi:hypothetical protein
MSTISQRHTLEDLEQISQGGTEEAIREALSRKKGGLNPVHVAILLAAIQSGRLLEILDIEKPEMDGPAPIQRIEALLERIVDKLESIEQRLSALEPAKKLPSGR